jgi:hypothetical protein
LGDDPVGRFWGIAAALAGLCVLAPAAAADNADVGAMAVVQRTVYGAPPQGRQAVKREGDAVVFKEELETADGSGAVVRFIDDSTLSIGAKSKVLIDEFVFDPGKAEGNALIRISVGTLRYVTGEMPKGKTTIKTPTATLVLRGTDVVVHVRPDGTTDTTVNEGNVDAHNDLTNAETNIAPGQGQTLGADGNHDFSGGIGPSGPAGGGNAGDPPEHRRGGDGGTSRSGGTTSHDSGGSGGPSN